MRNRRKVLGMEEVFLPTLAECKSKYVQVIRTPDLEESMTTPDRRDTEFEAEGLLRSTEGDSLQPGDAELLRIYATDSMNEDSDPELMSEQDVKRQ